ncbi:MAG: insulinase family protein [Chitinophagales bacterium]|nr:insulinase family protein [Chitinophagales bacterium]
MYAEMVNDIAKERQNEKLNKGVILYRALGSLAKYGKENPYSDRIPLDKLEEMNVDMLADKIKSLSKYQHRIFYYGNMPMADAQKIISKYHINTRGLQAVPAKKEYRELANEEQTIYYTNYDMQQVEMLFISRDELLNADLYAPASLFNEYFGSGLSSIIFQEIREKKALAYAAYSFYTVPSEKDKYHYTNAYIGTQADKLNDAVEAMFTLMNEMPEANMQFQAAKDATLKKIESSWTTGKSIYWTYETAQKQDLDYDINKVIYEQVKNMTLKDLTTFFNKHIKGKKYAICVIGSRENMKMEVLEKFGNIEEISLEDLFGF